VRRGNGAVQYTCRCSFFEILNERVFDLLDAAGGEVDLQVRENQRRGVFVDGLSESCVASAADAGMALGKGCRNRRVAETPLNRKSSRSHAVFQLLVESVEKAADASGVRKTKQSRFSLVDLAGSERQKSTSAVGDRLKEANAINKSLSALGQVINALVDRGLGKTRHVPYRDSKLTFLLRDSLGGNSRTFLVATVSPCDEHFGELRRVPVHAQVFATRQNDHQHGGGERGGSGVARDAAKRSEPPQARARKSQGASAQGHGRPSHRRRRTRID